MALRTVPHAHWHRRFSPHVCLLVGFWFAFTCRCGLPRYAATHTHRWVASFTLRFWLPPPTTLTVHWITCSPSSTRTAVTPFSRFCCTGSGSAALFTHCWFRLRFKFRLVYHTVLHRALHTRSVWFRSHRAPPLSYRGATPVCSPPVRRLRYTWHSHRRTPYKTINGTHLHARTHTRYTGSARVFQFLPRAPPLRSPHTRCSSQFYRFYLHTHFTTFPHGYALWLVRFSSLLPSSGSVGSCYLYIRSRC